MQYPFFRLDNKESEQGESATAYKFLSETRYDRIVFMKFISGHKWYSYEKHEDRDVNAAYHYETFSEINQETYKEILQDFMNWQPN
jgi:hypothetical protein